MGVQKFNQRVRQQVLTLGTTGDVSNGFPAPAVDPVGAPLKFKQCVRRPVLMNGSLGILRFGFPAPATDASGYVGSLDFSDPNNSQYL